METTASVRTLGDLNRNYDLILVDNCALNSISRNREKEESDSLRIAYYKDEAQFIGYVTWGILSGSGNFYFPSLVFEEIKKASEIPFKCSSDVFRKRGKRVRAKQQTYKIITSTSDKRRELIRAVLGEGRVISLDTKDSDFSSIYRGLTAAIGLSEADYDFLFSGMVLSRDYSVALLSNDLRIHTCLRRINKDLPGRLDFFVRDNFPNVQQLV